MPILTLRLVLKPQLGLGERFGRLGGQSRQAVPLFLSRKSEEMTFSASKTAQKPLKDISTATWAVPLVEGDDPAMRGVARRGGAGGINAAEVARHHVLARIDED